MRESIVLIFLLISVLLWGVLISSSAYLRDEKKMPMEIRLWVASIILISLGIIVFAYGTATTPEAIQSNTIAFTYANTLYLAGIVFQVLFCRSLRTPITKTTIFICTVSLIIFGLHFEYLRGSGNFTGRVLEVAFITGLCLIIQIVDLIKVIRKQKYTQLKILLIFTVFEFLLVVLRLIVAATQVNPVSTMSSVPFSLLVVLTFGLGFNVLSYLTMVGFWSERAISKRHSLQSENARIQQLLEERESLINSLMLSNKTAITGALSASLAHELNQPIGASRLNLFTLKKLLNDGGIKSSKIDFIIQHLDADNKRAGDIVHALRSVFSQNPVQVSSIKLSDLVNVVVGLVRGECYSKQILLNINVPSDLMVRVSSVEVQQVILNLLTNSIEVLSNHQSRSKTIWIATLPQNESFVGLFVEDDGPGVDSALIPKLFDLFSSQKSGGMGVGLWLSKFIMERSGGTIEYLPRNGGGSKFVVKIPLA